MLFRLTLASMRARATTVVISVLSVALSVTLFLGVEKLRHGARESFASTISGTDLVVGARSGGVQLLLYSVFRVGEATNNFSWQSYRQIAQRPEVDWIVPISLGDSHRQFRVMGTTNGYFERYKYRGDQSLSVVQGALMSALFDAVIGADVARALGYEIGDQMILSHGIASFVPHADRPFRVSGILEKTGTPVDRTVIVSLGAIEAIHVDWRRGQRPPSDTGAAAGNAQEVRPPTYVTAALVGVKSRLQIVALQRAVNTYRGEPLSAVLPGVALQELWQILGGVETALVAVSGLVVVTALLGLMATLFSTLISRQREMAIFRAMGAGPRVILRLMVFEAVVIAGLGGLLGIAVLYAGLYVTQPQIEAVLGLAMPISAPALRDAGVLVSIVLAAIVVSIAPALRAYRMSVSDGMMVRN
ncbi:MAG: ABC transporter permease [Pseudomonadota bacterium]